MKVELITDWCCSWSDLFSFWEILDFIEHGASPADFHTPGWWPPEGRGITFQDLMDQEGWSLLEVKTNRSLVVEWAIRLTDCEVANLVVTISDDKAVMTGVVASFYDNKLAQDAALAVMGPGRVVNDIIVSRRRVESTPGFLRCRAL